MAHTLKPQFYAVRPNGIAVPYIAVDELPHNIRIEGVPRILTHKDTCVMKSIGEVEARHQTFDVYDTNKSSSMYLQRQMSPGPILAPTIQTESADCQIPALHLAADEIFPGPKKYYGLQEHKPEHDSDTALIPMHSVAAPKVSDVLSKFEPLPTWKKLDKLGPRLPVPGRKIYCTHWLHTGECDYAQQGCLYKHEMPEDLELLNSIGFQDIPKWYREKFGIGRLTAVPGSGAHIQSPTAPASVMSSDWRRSIGRKMGQTGLRAPTSAPRNRQPILTTSKSEGRKRNGHTTPRPASEQRDLLNLDIISSATSPVLAKKGLLDSRYAVLRPSSASSSSATNDLSTDTGSFMSSNAEGDSKTPNASVESLATTLHNTPKRDLKDVSTARQGRWQSYAGSNQTSRRVCPSKNHTSSSSYDPLGSDHEGEIVREDREREEREKQQYAETVARYKSQKEQETLKQMQDEAVTSAHQKLHDETAASTLRHQKTSSDSVKGTARMPIRRKGKKSIQEQESRGEAKTSAT